MHLAITDGPLWAITPDLPFGGVVELFSGLGNPISEAKTVCTSFSKPSAVLSDMSSHYLHVFDVFGA